MSKIQGNKSDSKAIKELIAKFPNYSIQTDIEEGDAHFYHILACSVSVGRGTNVELKTRIITTSELDYNNQVAKKIFNPSSYLCDEIHILHDPMQYAKDMAAEKKAAKKEKE